MGVLIDTNLALRLAEPPHRSHVTAKQAMATLNGLGAEMCVVPQVFYELWVVATRPASVQGLG